MWTPPYATPKPPASGPTSRTTPATAPASGLPWNAFSVAGPSGSYRYALSAHQGIADVAVYAPVPGTVDVRPVADGELPRCVLELVWNA